MLSPRLVLAAYAAVAALNLAASGTGDQLLNWLTKPLLMPLLACWLWAVSRGGSVPIGGIVAALMFSAAGDVALNLDGTVWFVTGMLLFLGAHICYIGTFVRDGAIERLRAVPLIGVPIALLVVLVAALVWLWPGLSRAGLAMPMAGYGLALAGTAATAAAFGWRTGLGGLLFLVSDLLIAVRVAGAGELPGPPIWVMLTYITGQVLLVTGWMHWRRGAPVVAREELAISEP